MTLPRWDEEMKFELLRLKSELRSENFRVLHTPIGLGRLTASRVESPSDASLLAGSPTFTSSVSDFQFKPVAQKLMESRLAAVPSLPTLPTKSVSSMSRSLTKILIIHTLDVGFVVMTLGFGLLLATWLIDPGHGPANPELLKQATPLRFLLENNLFVLALGLYGFFTLYWLFFKLVSGSTLGESFLDNFWSLQNPGKASSVKDSGDS